MNLRQAALRAWIPLVLLGAASSPMGCSSDDDDTSAEPVGDSGPTSETDAGVAEDAPADSAAVEEGGPPCNEGGWCRTTLPGVPVPTLNAVFSVSPTRAVAAGETCVIQGREYLCTTSLLLWDGSAWTTLARGLPRLTGIWASDANHFWIVNEKGRSLYHLTFNGGQPTLASVSLPYDFVSCSDAKLTVSGTSEANIYVAAYCYKSDQTTRGLLFHRQPGDGGGEPVWATVWDAGGNSGFQAALGAVFVAPSGEAWAAGWKIHAPVGTYGARYYIPSVMNTLVLHVTGDGVQEQELESSLAMCAQSIWSSGSGAVFVGGVCDGGYTDFTSYTTLARYGQVDGGTGWSAVYQTPIGQYGAIGASFPLLWGVTGTEIYAVGSWATMWNGSALKTVSLALHGAPVANRVLSVHGSSSKDVWMVGNGFAVHRAQ